MVKVPLTTGSPAGLCSSCVHVRRVESARGSVFWLCRRAERDPRYRKYPSLPVLRCLGYEKAGEDDGRGG